MRFFLSFVAVLAVILLIVRFKPQTPADAEPIIPTQLKEASGRPDEENATPVAPGTNDVRDGSKDSTETVGAEGQPVSTLGRPAAGGTVYGAALTADNARPMQELAQLLGTRDSARVKLTGKAASVCQAKGCWMTLTTADGQPMRVKFKDYAFFVPKDIAGKTVVVEGWAHRETVSLEDQRHYERDAGKSEKEVAAITKPQQQLNFMADGVLVQN